MTTKPNLVTPFLCIGFVIGGLLAFCEIENITSHLPFVWLSTYGMMFLFAFQYAKKYPPLFLITLIPSFLASIPCLWLLNASYNVAFSSVVLATISAYALNAFHLNYHRNHFVLSYETLFHAVWDTFIQLFVAFIFTLLCWAILSLAGSLFALVKFTFLNTLLSKHWFQWWSTAFFTSMGLSIAAQTQQIIRNIRGILLLICQYLFIPLSIIGLIFIALSIATVVTHPLAFDNQVLFLSIAFLSVIFINGIYQDGSAKNPYSRAVSMLCQLFIIVTPLFTLLALFALIFTGHNSINEEGINAANFPYLLNIILLLSYNLSYAVIIVMREKSWLKSIEKTNICLALIVITLTLLTTNPWYLHTLPAPKNGPYFNTKKTPAEKNAQLIKTFEAAGFSWEKSSNGVLPKNVLALGYDQSLLYFCRPENEKNVGGVVKNNQCEWITEQQAIQKSANFTVLSGPEKKLTWLEWKLTANINQKTLIILDATAKNPTAICRLIYQNHIVIGTTKNDACTFIANGKVVSETQLLQFLYHV